MVKYRNKVPGLCLDTGLQLLDRYVCDADFLARPGLILFKNLVERLWAGWLVAANIGDDSHLTHRTVAFNAEGLVLELGRRELSERVEQVACDVRTACKGHLGVPIAADLYRTPFDVKVELAT